MGNCSGISSESTSDDAGVHSGGHRQSGVKLAKQEEREAKPESVRSTEKNNIKQAHDDETVTFTIDMNESGSNPIEPSIEKRSSPESQGVSVHWLRNGLLKEVEEAGFTTSSKIYEIEDLSDSKSLGVIRRKGQHVRCPMFDCMGAAYVHCLSGEDNVGDATHMLSYTWGYSVGDIIDTLESFCDARSLDPKRTYIWICCLCNNQHKIVGDRDQEEGGGVVPPEEFEATFRGRVLGIGRLICMMSPWYDPRYLHRVWCIFEIYTAMTHENSSIMDSQKETGNGDLPDGVELHVEMPPRERKRMWNEIITKGPTSYKDKIRHGTSDRFFEAVSNTKVELADTSVESDKNMILNLLRSNGRSYADTNSRVNDYIRNWFQHSIELMAEAARSQYMKGDQIMPVKQFATVCNNVGLLFFDMGISKESALGFFEEFRALVESKKHLFRAEDLAAAHNNIGMVLDDMSRYEEALIAYKNALTVHDAIFKRRKQTNDAYKDKREFQLLFHNIGQVFQKMGRFDDALSSFRQALAVIVEADELNIQGDAELEMSTQDPLVTGACYFGIGLVMNKMGLYQDALVALKEALGLYLAASSPSHPSVANVRNAVGLVHYNLGHVEEAIEEYTEALAIFEVTLGKESGKAALAYNNIAGALEAQGRVEEALQHYGKAVAIREAVMGQRHPDTAQSLNNIGCLLTKMGRNVDAMKEHQKALSIRQESLGGQHPDTAQSIDNIAALLHMMKQDEKALVEFRRAAAIRESALGKDSLVTAISYDNIGMQLANMLRYEDGMLELRKALAIRERILGQRNLVTCSSYENIGSVLIRSGQVAAALGSFRKALVIREDFLGPKHPETARANIRFGEILLSIGKHEQALNLFQKAIAVQNKTLPKHHPEIVMSHGNVGMSLRGLGQHEQALTAFRKALDIIDAIPSEYKQLQPYLVMSEKVNQRANLHNSIGEQLKLLQRHGEALEEFRKSLHILETEQVRNYVGIATVRNSIGEELVHLGNIEEAVRQFSQGLLAHDCAVGKDHPNTVTLRRNLGFSMKILGQNNEALIELRRALAMSESTPDNSSNKALETFRAALHNDLGEVLSALKSNEEALMHFKKALAILECVFGSRNHLHTTALHSNIGVALQRLDRHDEALTYHRTVLSIQEEHLVEHNQLTARTYGCIGSALRKLSQYEEALVSHQKASSLCEKLLGEQTLDSARSHDHVGDTLMNLSRKDEASIEFSKALAIFESKLGMNHQDTVALSIKYHDAKERIVVATNENAADRSKSDAVIKAS